MSPEESEIADPENPASATGGEPTFRSGRVLLGILLSWLGALICMALLHREAGIASRICAAGSGCEVVLTSRFASMKGVPLPWIGLVFYLIVFAVLIVVLSSTGQSRRVALWSSVQWACVAGVTFSALLMYAQFGILHAFCPLCTGSALVMAGLVAVLAREESVWGQPVAGARATALALSAMAILSGAVVSLTGGKPSGGAVASVDGRKFSREQMEEELAVPLERLERDRYELESAWAREKVELTLLASEANRLGTSSEKLLADRAAHEPEISEAEIDAQMAKMALPTSDENRTAARQQLMIERRSRTRTEIIAAFAAKHSANIFLRRPTVDRMKIDLATAKISGSRNAPVQLVVFSDFQCPFCAQLAPVLERIRAEFPDKVMIAFRYFPLDTHPRALPAAIAAECAAEQGKFWEYHDRLFADGRDLSADWLLAIAGKVGLDKEKFQQCLRAPRAREIVQASLQNAIAEGLDGAPAVFLNGTRIGGRLDFDELTKLIRDKLKTNKS